MNDKWTQAGVLDALQTGRRRWEALLTEVGDARMTTAIPALGWSGKDIVAHITWYEQQMAGLLQPHSGPGPARDWLWECAADKRNAILFWAHHDDLLPDVCAEARQAYSQLVTSVKRITAANLRVPQRFPDMPRGWQPWQLIARHSYKHYEEHIPGIRAWLAAQGSESDQGICGSAD
jgi:hypothetical protein